jgi:hypothetical protein
MSHTPKKKPSARARPASFGDPTNHGEQIDPGHSERLRAQSVRSTDPDEGAFLPESRTTDPLAEHLGEAFVETVTTGEDDEEETLDQIVPEEAGGPFVVSSAAAEFAPGTDESNPPDAEKAPFPTT